MKYARTEVERRFLLDVVPVDTVESREITDHYLDGTQLRLRKVEERGVPTVHKLGHKQRPDRDDGIVVFHTTIYLTESEYALLRSLPSHELRKTRSRVPLGDRDAIVDVFSGALEGLVVLEVGFDGREEAEAFIPPSWVGAETTLSGGELASMSAAELSARLAAS
jgi:CYTH domain-containing protein